MTDVNDEALERSKTLIYPSRYGEWDSEIVLTNSLNYDSFLYDAIFIGTPPTTHVPLALDEFKRGSVPLIMIEKPLSAPNLMGIEELSQISAYSGSRILVGYNHRVAKVVEHARNLIQTHDFGEVYSVRAKTREHWSGILSAHPWLDSPQSSYLGSMEEGGGALLEHSHSLNLFLYFCDLLKVGRVTHVSAVQDIRTVSGKSYDQNSQLSLRTESGCLGLVEQDVISNPSEKTLAITAENGILQISFSSELDTLVYKLDDQPLETLHFRKKRSDDFISEVAHIETLLSDSHKTSPLDLHHAIYTMNIIKCAIESNHSQREIALPKDQRS